MSRAGNPHGKKEDHMIETAIQKGSYVYVYGQGNRTLFSCPGELHGFTSATVSVREGYAKTTTGSAAKTARNTVIVTDTFPTLAIAENPSLKHSVVGAGLLDHGILAVDYLHQTVYFQRFDQTEVRDEVIEDKVVIIPGKVNDITGAYFKANIHDYSHGTDFTYSGDKPIVIDFWATWCGPCKKMAPLFEQWAEKYKDRIIFLKVNADKEKELCNKFKVNALPTFIFLPVGGRPIIEVRSRMMISRPEIMVTPATAVIMASIIQTFRSSSSSHEKI